MYVGGGGKAISLMATLAPRLFDLTAPSAIMALQKRKEAPRRPQGSLHAAMHDGEERGSHSGFVNPFSLYTRLSAHPEALLAVAVLPPLPSTRRRGSVGAER